MIIVLANDGENLVKAVTVAVAEGFCTRFFNVAAGEADDGKAREADGADAGAAALKNDAGLLGAASLAIAAE